VRALAAILLVGCAAPSPPVAPARSTLVSGGALLPEQAAYDVLHYSLDLRVDPKEQSIDGTLTVRARFVAPARWLVLDLDDLLRVRACTVGGRDARFVHEHGRLWIEASGDVVEASIVYGGRPRVAPNPPWEGGFTWAKTANGKPWIATSCQGEGADLWWPCKDHPSDKADTMDLKIAVPDGLTVATNGVLVGDTVDGGWRTFHWRVTSPSSNYVIALNIAPYAVLRETFASTTGAQVPVAFYVLPENVEKARRALPHFIDYLRFYEDVCGPFPFGAEKYGIAETPHLGMEHKTIIAYGNKFQGDADGYDWLLHHELSHEWWGNLVTCRDWRDMWIHEGIGTYMQALYLERKRGAAAMRAEVAQTRSRIANRRPVAPRESQDTKAIYTNPDGTFNGDIYFKGACFMHAMRWLLGDETFFRVLRTLAYPEDGSTVRFSDTEEIREIAERVSGRHLGWLFEVYLRRAKLPRLTVTQNGDDWTFAWDAGGLAFPMPLPVEFDGAMHRVETPDGRATVRAGAKVAVDPHGWLMFER